MLKQRGEKTADGKWSASSAERNKGPILDVLARVLPRRGLVLEIASGTGQHVVHFAKALPDLTWQPSDPDAELRESIALRVREEQCANIKSPIDLDVTRLPWPLQTADAVLAINMIHVAPWSATPALFEGAKARRRCFPRNRFCSCTDPTVVTVSILRTVTRSSMLIFVRTIPSGAFATWRPYRMSRRAPDSCWPRPSRCRPTTSVWFSNDAKASRVRVGA